MFSLCDMIFLTGNFKFTIFTFMTIFHYGLYFVMFKKFFPILIDKDILFLKTIIFIYLAMLGLSYGMQDPFLVAAKKNVSSLTREQTWPHALGVQSLSHWTTREVPILFLLKVFY